MLCCPNCGLQITFIIFQRLCAQRCYQQTKLIFASTENLSTEFVPRFKRRSHSEVLISFGSGICRAPDFVKRFKVCSEWRKRKILIAKYSQTRERLIGFFEYSCTAQLPRIKVLLSHASKLEDAKFSLWVCHYRQTDLVHPVRTESLTLPSISMNMVLSSLILYIMKINTEIFECHDGRGHRVQMSIEVWLILGDCSTSAEVMDTTETSRVDSGTPCTFGNCFWKMAFTFGTRSLSTMKSAQF